MKTLVQIKHSEVDHNKLAYLFSGYPWSTKRQSSQPLEINFIEIHDAVKSELISEKLRMAQISVVSDINYAE